jgi:3-hydroxybutyryl-CoA dehydrogenase
VSVRKLLVAGAGQMGAGIVQVAAQAGIEAVMIDVADEFVAKGMDGIEKGYGKMVDKGRMEAADRDAALARITTGLSVEAGADADLFIEAAPESIELKSDLLQRVSATLRKDAIIATNTSSLSVSELADFVEAPERFVGIHFFNPVAMMALVEVVRGAASSDATVAAARAFAETVGKTPITVKDSPGFVVNRILFPMINEAVRALAEGVASAEDIDTGMKLGANFPMGPLALADLVGLDTTQAILATLERDLGDPVTLPVRCSPSTSPRASSGARAGRDSIRMADAHEGREGFVQLYTGDGKGKTTAALGLVLRALGHDLHVAVLQFMKANPTWGEIVMLRRLGVEVVQCGLDHWVIKGDATTEDLAAAAAGFARARDLVMSGEYDVVVLDELVTALFFELVALDDVLALMRARPAHVELVITGRRAPDELVEAADLVTEMVPRKHYYDAGVEAREGIEF